MLLAPTSDAFQEANRQYDLLVERNAEVVFKYHSELAAHGAAVAAGDALWELRHRAASTTIQHRVLWTYAVAMWAQQLYVPQGIVVASNQRGRQQWRCSITRCSSLLPTR